MVLQKSWLILGGLGFAGFLLLALLLLSGLPFKNTPAKSAQSENSDAITATYVATRLQQIDKAHATLFFSYDLENNTDTDYRLADGPDIFIMARLKMDGSLSQEEDVRLTYPVVVPARQRVRITIAEEYPFTWPPAMDSSLDDRLKNFVKHRLENIAGFVLFDEIDHFQVELPNGWATVAKN
jgi:hypothetical protein